jgi:hypothetical protein
MTLEFCEKYTPTGGVAIRNFSTTKDCLRTIKTSEIADVVFVFAEDNCS